MRNSEILREACGPGPDCPPLEQLDLPEFAPHVESCAHCRTELSLLRSFEEGAVRAEEAAAVKQITERLRARSGEILAPPEPKRPWWELFRTPWLTPAVFAMAAILLTVTLTMQTRPSLPAAVDGGEVMRAGNLAITSPMGELDAKPHQFEWTAAADATKYVAQLLEVDGNEFWKGETTEARIELPAEVQARILPAKTLILVVRAEDGSGRAIATSGKTRFRVR